MPTIHPFRGLRYDQEMVDNLAIVTCPPYDVISPEQQRDFYGKHEANIIRVELSEALPDDNDEENRYTRAAAAFADWRKRGILDQEDAPALYVYEQLFSGPKGGLRRRAILCSVQLTPWSAGEVLPHEETMSGPKADRRQLLRAVKANISPIFGLFRDTSKHMYGQLELICVTPPAVTFVDEAGEGHRLWVVDEPKAVKELTETLSGHPILIADGHHRYETALAYRQEPTAPPASHDVLFALVADNDPGLIVLPTHRAIGRLSAEVVASLSDRIADRFDVRPIGALGVITPDQIEAMLTEFGMPSFALAGYPTGQVSILSPIGDWRSQLPEGHSEAWQNLDLVVLHELLIKPILGIDVDEEGEGRVRFTRDLAGALTDILDGRLQLTAILNPPLPEIIRNVADAGDRMPHKSTYFYPKMRTGIVMRAFS